jgi:hypothetical protein
MQYPSKRKWDNKPCQKNCIECAFYKKNELLTNMFTAFTLLKLEFPYLFFTAGAFSHINMSFLNPTNLFISFSLLGNMFTSKFEMHLKNFNLILKGGLFLLIFYSNLETELTTVDGKFWS